MKESSNLRTKIVNVNQMFRGYSLFISGFKATEKRACNVTLQQKQKSQRLQHALTLDETKVHMETFRV